MDNLPYIKRNFNFAPVLQQFNDILDYLESLNQPLGSFKELQGRTSSTAGIKNLHQPHTWPELEEFIDTACSISTEVFGVQDRITYPEKLIRSWSNRYWPGSNIEEHTHDGVDIVFSCYINKPKDSGDLELFYNGRWNVIPIETNDIIVFPGTIKHRTEINKSVEPRVVMSINTNHYVQPFLKEMQNPKISVNEADAKSKDFMKFFENKMKELELKLLGLE
jgi:hypothetical protein